MLKDFDCVRAELTILKNAIDPNQNLAPSKNHENPVQEQNAENQVSEIQEALDSKLRDCPALLKLEN